MCVCVGMQYILLKILKSFNMFMYMGMYMEFYEHVKPEDSGIPGVGVTGSCELPNMGSGNHCRVLSNSNKCS